MRVWGNLCQYPQTKDHRIIPAVERAGSISHTGDKAYHGTRGVSQRVLKRACGRIRALAGGFGGGSKEVGVLSI